MNASFDLLSTLLSALTLLGSITIASSQAIAQNTTSYPAEAVEVFTKTCTEQGDSKTIPPEAMREICTCSIQEIQKTYTFEQFTQIGTGLGQGKAAPAELTSIVQACVAQVTKK